MYEVCTEILSCAGHFGRRLFVRLNASVRLENVGMVGKSVWMLKINKVRYNEVFLYTVHIQVPAEE